VGLGVDFFASGRDAKAAGTDALIAGETVALAGLFGQAVKLAIARERPGARARDGTRGSRDEHASFYSGHTNSAFAVAVALATCASLRGDPDAWVAWAAGLPLAAATGYLRIAADRHYLSDVLAGAGAGALFGILVPRLLHSPSAASTPQPGAARFPVLTFGGRF
jgi:membrane-associated phospholipid phosphatase